MTELKPCPFCGAEPEVKFMMFTEGRAYLSIRCPVGHSEMRAEMWTDGFEIDFEDIAEMKEDAETDWNRRAETYD